MWTERSCGRRQSAHSRRTPNLERVNAASELWHVLGGDPSLLERVHASSAEFRRDALPSSFHVLELGAAAFQAAALAAGELQAARFGGPVPAAQLDLVAVANALRSEQLAHRIGWPRTQLFDPLSRVFEASDGWVRLHGNYRQHRAAVARALKLPIADPTMVAHAVAKLTADDPGYVDYYGRPWAKNWEQWFEQGWNKPSSEKAPADVLKLFN